jgi:uncharacterized membrane protein YbhN (UPF0104 family)
MSRRHRLIALWTAASLVLLLALFPAFGARPSSVADALASGPWTMYAAVLLLTVLNQLAGAQKWRVAAARLADGGASYALRHAFETTVLGALLGQVVPIQLTTAMVRGIMGEKAQGGARIAVGATVYEQAFDLVVLLPAGVAGAFALLLDCSTALSAGLMLTAAVGSIVVAPSLFDFARAVTAFTGRTCRGRAAHLLGRVSTALSGAARVPTGTSLELGLLSLFRLGCMAARVAVIASALAPTADSASIALGYPTVGIIGALPVTPAGLGVVEWSWSGLLVHAGAPPADAVTAAISMRLINLLVLAVILLAVVALRFTVRRPDSTGRPAR